MTRSDCDRASRAWFTSNNVSAASSHAAPTNPRLRGPTCRSEKPPSAAPSEKPRYMNDAFSESATGADGTPTISMSRVCCAGKNAHEDIPQRAMAASTGTTAAAGATKLATTARPASPRTRLVRLARSTSLLPSRSVAFPLTNNPKPAASPHVNSARPIWEPAEWRRAVKKRSDIRVDRVRSACPERGHGERPRDTRIAHGPHAITERCRDHRGADAARQPSCEPGGRDGREPAYAHERHAPTKPLADERAERHTEGDRRRQPAVDDGDRSSALLRWHERARERVGVRRVDAGGEREQHAGCREGRGNCAPSPPPC